MKNIEDSPRSQRHTLSRCKMALALLVLLSGGILLYACATERGVYKVDARMERDAITGVIHGLEARTLLPHTIEHTPRPPTPEAQLEGVTTGSACLLVHGFVGSHRDFSNLGEKLAACGLTVRMMRLPGHGTSPADFAYQPSGAMLRAVRQEYADLRAQYARVYLVGFSMGGALATLLAAESDPDGLVLVAPYFGVNYQWYYILPAEKWNALMRHLIRFVPKPDWAIRLNDRSVLHQIFAYKFIPTGGVKQLVEIGLQARQPKVLGSIKCPVLLIHSSGDRAASFRKARKAYDAIGAPKEALWLTRSNHHILWDYDREESMTRIRGFLRNLENPADFVR